jgi:hypothetical protein
VARKGVPAHHRSDHQARQASGKVDASRTGDFGYLKSKIELKADIIKPAFTPREWCDLALCLLDTHVLLVKVRLQAQRWVIVAAQEIRKLGRS